MKLGVERMGNVNKLRKIIEMHYKNIDTYWKAFYSTFYPPQRIHVLHMLEVELRQLSDLIIKYDLILEKHHREELSRDNELRQFTKAELEKYNGAGGNPAYIAVNGIVYDVTFNPQWGGGTHFGITAGRDVTKEFEKCHGGEDILSKLEIVGELVEE